MRLTFHRSLTVLLGVVVLAGCADIITYSKDSRKQGLKLYNQEQYADAAGAFRNATKQNPLDYKSYCYLGASYEQLNQHEQAISAFRTSLKVMSTDIDGKRDIAFRQNVLNGLASAVSKCDQRDSEVNDIESKAKTNGSAEDWFLVAKICAYRGDADSAIEAYGRAARIDPDNYYITREQGLYLEHMGQNRDAEEPLRKAYGTRSDDQQVADALRRIGVVPGPSIKDQSALAKPIIPEGPIPEVDVNKLISKAPWQTQAQPAPEATPTQTPPVPAANPTAAASPRD